MTPISEMPIATLGFLRFMGVSFGINEVLGEWGFQNQNLPWVPAQARPVVQREHLAPR